ncbi:MAG: hypothetical protein II868_01095 [Butyrivibrio sp.]|nr:hypothetical protein [Butyrivibrio sp.]
MRTGVLRITAVLLAIVMLGGCTGTGAGGTDSSNAAYSRTRVTKNSSSKHDRLIGFSYSPGYSDMMGAYYAEEIIRAEDGTYTYVVTEREYHSAPDIKTVYAFDEEGMDALKEIIDEYDICALEKRRKSNDFVYDYSPWRYSLRFDDSATGGDEYVSVSFNEYQRYRKGDEEALDELLNAARALRGEQIDTVTEGGEENTSTEEESDINLATTLYEEVLAETNDILVNGYDFDRTYRYASSGLMEFVNYVPLEEAQHATGYAFADISGDFVPELLIGGRWVDDNGKTMTDIFQCFSVKNGELVMVFEGWGRNRTQWLSENRFLLYASSGAASSGFGVRHFTGEDTDMSLYAHEIETVWEDFYFSEGDEAGNVSYYHNTTGVWDAAESEQVTMEGGAFWQIYEELEEQCKPFPFQPVTSYFKQKALREQGAAPDAEAIVGSFGLLSYVSHTVLGYNFFDDGTWATDVIYHAFMYPHEMSEKKNASDLFGTWETVNDPGGTAYQLYDADGVPMDIVRVNDITEPFAGKEIVFENGKTYLEADER